MSEQENGPRLETGAASSSAEVNPTTSQPLAWIPDVFSERQLHSLTFTKLWQKSVAASDLSKAEKGVALILSLYFSGGEEETADPSLARLAQEASVGNTTVVRALDILDRRGFVARERTRGRVRTTYRLTVPPFIQLSHSEPVDGGTVETPTDPNETPTVPNGAPTVPKRGLNRPTVEYEGVKGFHLRDKKGDEPSYPTEDQDPNGETQAQIQAYLYDGMSHQDIEHRVLPYLDDGKPGSAQAIAAVWFAMTGRWVGSGVAA